MSFFERNDQIFFLDTMCYMCYSICLNQFSEELHCSNLSLKPSKVESMNLAFYFIL